MAALRTVACERCNRRKQRCDRKLPTCSQCAVTSAECRNGRSEAIMTRTAVGTVQVKGFVELLEGRLEELEALSRRHGINVPMPREEPPTHTSRQLPAGSASCSTTNVSGRVGLEQHTQFSSRTGIDATEGHSRRHSPDIGLLSLSAMAEPNSRASEFLQGISMPGIISAITESYGGNPEKTTRIDALWHGIAKDIRSPTAQSPDRLHLPPDEALGYVKTYYDVVDYRFPHLPREEVMIGIAAITASNEADYEETLLHDPAKVFAAYMVLAITPLVSDTYPVAQASFISIHILAKALKILSNVFRMEDGVDIIYCLRLLVIFSLHSSAAGSTWHLMGVTMKKCIALGFHREVTRPNQDTSQEELEHRRWAFWSCYFLDRLISCALDRPFSINDTNITIRLPGSGKPFSSALSPSQMRHIHLYRYALLQSRVTMDKGAQPFSSHLSHLVHWETSAPVLPEHYPMEQEEHMNSLFNSLSLRAMIDQFFFARPTYAGSSILNSDANSSAFTALPPFGILDFVSCCQSVVSSMNRRSMQKRSTLSWITGYSTIRACFGLLYCLVRNSLKLDQQLLDNEEIQKCQSCIEIGMDVLSVVSRQFPVMLEYNNLISSIRICLKNGIQAAGFNSGNEPQHQLMSIIRFVGPDGIYSMAEQIVELLLMTSGTRTV